MKEGEKAKTCQTCKSWRDRERQARLRENAIAQEKISYVKLITESIEGLAGSQLGELRAQGADYALPPYAPCLGEYMQMIKDKTT